MQSTPGEKLAKMISDIVHAEAPDRSFLSNIDGLFCDDGEFFKTCRNSIIYYAVRRLIHGVSFALEKAQVHYADSANAISIIKDFVSQNYSFPLDTEQLSVFHALLYSCVCAANKDLTKAERNDAICWFKEHGIATCYLCGVEVDFDSVDQKNSASVEHKFPREYGGDSNLYNLALACKDCNRHKDDHMHVSDFHYEKISTKYDTGNPKFNSQLLVSRNVVALWMKENCQCTICGRPAQQVGQLNVFQKEPSDSWHFMNIGVQCAEHDKER